MGEGEDNVGYDPDESHLYRKLQIFPYENSETSQNGLAVPQSSGYNLSGSTLQVLPTESNYRRLSQIHQIPRPTMEELMSGKLNASADDVDHQAAVKTEGEVIKLGWVNGVLIRVLLSIWGTMLFLRLAWVMGQSGMIQGLVVITVCNVITIITTLSMSAVATNGRIASGGVYYMISRALGPEFGGAIGILFALAQSVGCGMTTFGFCSSLFDFIKDMDENFDGFLPGSSRDDYTNEMRLIGTITLIILLVLAIVGMKWITRVQKILFIMLVVAQLDMIVGTFLPKGSAFLPDEAERHSKGFTGWSIDTVKKNIDSNYVDFEGEQMTFILIFGVFFNSVTGIVAGANMSGDLKDPSQSIAKGTLTGIIMTYITYMGFGIMICFTYLREASGNVEEYWRTYSDLPEIGNCTAEANQVRAFYNLTYTDCNEYGSAHDQKVMTYMSASGYLVYLGCFGATLSSSIANIEGAPRVIQAVGKDKIYPYIDFFGVGHGPNDEPVRGYIFTIAIAFGCVMIGSLNEIGYIATNFILAGYALMNFSTFHSSISKSPGWRPSFKYYNPWISLLGAIGCIVVMIVIKWLMAVITIAVMVVLFGVTLYIKPDVNWGSSVDALTYMNALNNTISLNEKKEHVKTYRPQILLLSGTPAHRQPLVDFANLITKKISLLVCANIITDVDKKESQDAKDANESWLKEHDIKAFYTSIVNKDFSQGADSAINLTGLGKLSPNLLILGYHQMKHNPGRTSDYYETLINAFEANIAVGILRLQNGLDYSNEIYSEESTNDKHNPYIFRDKEGNALPNTMVQEIQTFRSGSRSGTIDIWWLFDDGGLTILIPYLIQTRKQYSHCKLRVFALTNNENEMDESKRELAGLLHKFRIDISEVLMISDITNPAELSTREEFESILKEYPDYETSQDVIDANKQKTNRYLRTAELLRKHSMQAELVVVTLPLPRKKNLDPVYYMAWLEIITRQMPPIFLVRGNQSSVLTFYS